MLLALISAVVAASDCDLVRSLVHGVFAAAVTRDAPSRNGATSLPAISVSPWPSFLCLPPNPPSKAFNGSRLRC